MPVESTQPLAFAILQEDYALSNLGLPSWTAEPRATAIRGSNVALQPAAAAVAQAPQASLLSLLLPTLLSSFLDAAPAAFSPSAINASASSGPASSNGLTRDLDTVRAVISTAHVLYWRELGGSAYSGTGDGSRSEGSALSTPSSQAEARKSLLILLTHAAAYFPFTNRQDDALGLASAGSGSGSGARAGGVSGQESDALMRLNLTFASLVSLLVLDSSSGPSAGLGTSAAKGNRTKTRVKRNEERDRKVTGLVDRVREWVAAALRGEVSRRGEARRG